MKKANLLLMLFIAILKANAITYYVSTSGANTDGKSLSNAFRTMQQAANVMVAGDICEVADGTYSSGVDVKINTNGASTSWTMFKSTNKKGAKILIASTAAEYSQGFSLNDSKYIIIDGFDISAQNTHGNGIGTTTTGNHHIRIYNCEIHDCGQAGIGLCNGDYYTIEWNSCHNNSYKSTWQGSGISIYECRKSDSNPGFHNIIANNICYGNENKVGHPTNGITDGNGIIVDDLNCSQNAPNTVYDQATLVENNVCFDNGGRGVYVMSSRNVTFRNNTAYMNSRIVGDGDLVCHEATNITWVNNIGWARSGKYAISDNGAWGTNSNIIWKNNLTFNGIVGQNSVNIAKTSTTSIDSTNKLGLNPIFVDVANSNFRLQSGSPAINVGSSAYGLPLFDADYLTRVIGNAVDIGAYEYNTTTGIFANAAEEMIKIYPNPANQLLVISYQLLENSEVKISLFDVLGKEVMNLVNEKQTVGEHNATINTGLFDNGIYFIRMDVNTVQSIQKVIISN